MEVSFRQIYGTPGASFPFSHLFQRRTSEEVSAVISPSSRFLKKYGDDFELILNVSAKPDLQANEIRGPSVYRKTRDIEYTVFLPFDVIVRQPDAPRQALIFLLKGVYYVLDLLGIDKSILVDTRNAIIEGICSDPTMLAMPSWDEPQHRTAARVVFESFFNKDAHWPISSQGLLDPPPVDMPAKDWFEALSNFGAGLGDGVSGGLTQRARQGLGYDDVVWYSAARREGRSTRSQTRGWKS